MFNFLKRRQAYFTLFRATLAFLSLYFIIISIAPYDLFFHFTVYIQLFFIILFVICLWKKSFRYFGIAISIIALILHFTFLENPIFFPSLGGKITAKQNVILDLNRDSSFLFLDFIFRKGQSSVSSSKDTISVNELLQQYPPGDLQYDTGFADRDQRIKHIELIKAGSVMPIIGLQKTSCGTWFGGFCYEPILRTPAGSMVILDTDDLKDTDCSHHESCTKFHNYFGGKWHWFEGVSF